MKCAVAAYLPEERRAKDSTIYLVGVAEWLTVAFHLFIGAPQEAPLLEAEFIADWYVVSHFIQLLCVTLKLPVSSPLLECFPLSDSSSLHALRDIWTTKKSTVWLTCKQ